MFLSEKQHSNRWNDTCITDTQCCVAAALSAACGQFTGTWNSHDFVDNECDPHAVDADNFHRHVEGSHGLVHGNIVRLWDVEHAGLKEITQRADGHHIRPVCQLHRMDIIMVVTMTHLLSAVKLLNVILIPTSKWRLYVEPRKKGVPHNVLICLVAIQMPEKTEKFWHCWLCSSDWVRSCLTAH